MKVHKAKLLMKKQLTVDTQEEWEDDIKPQSLLASV